MRGRVERGQERKSRRNQMGQKRRKSLLGFLLSWTQVLLERGTTSQVTLIHTLKPQESDLVLVPESPGATLLSARAIQSPLGSGRFGTALGSESFWAGLPERG